MVARRNMVEMNQEGAISVMFILMYVCGAALRYRKGYEGEWWWVRSSGFII